MENGTSRTNNNAKKDEAAKINEAAKKTEAAVQGKKKSPVKTDPDSLQRKYLELEYSLAQRNKGVNLSLISFFFAFIFVFAALFWILPDRELSEEENRALQGFPEFTWERLVQGTFTEEFGSYMADQFPARSFFVGLKAASETALLKGQNNGVMLGSDGYLVTRFDSVDEDILENNIDCISTFKQAAEQAGHQVTVAFAGRTVDTAVSKISSVYGSEMSERTWAALGEMCSERELVWCDLAEPLRARMDSGEYVYYKTDHHWTTLGALYAYNEIAVKADLPLYSPDEFEREIASEEFFGTTWSSAGVKWAKPDTLEFFRYEGDDALVCQVEGGEGFEGLYKRDALETKDKYSSFIGGNAARVNVYSTEEEREKLLIVKDSFAHSTVPFFAREYDLVIIDLRYYTGSLLSLMEQESIEKAILLYNMDTLSNESGFRIFKMK